MKSRNLLALVASLLLLGALGVGFTQGERTLRFTIWSGNQAHLDMLNRFAEAFKDEYPSVNVQLDVIPFGEYIQKVTLQLAGGNPPDLGWIAEAAAPTFIEAGVLAELSDVLKADPEYDFADFSEPALKLWVRGDEIYGVPFSTSPLITFYNRDMFEAAGVANPAELVQRGEWTWERFREIARRVTEMTPAGTYGFETGTEGYGAHLWGTITPMLRAYGADAWNTAGTECLLNSPEAVQAMEMYHGLIFEDRAAVPPGEQADFFTGRSAMTMTQLSRTALLVDASFEWGIAPLPKGPAGDVALVGQAALVVFQNAQNRDLAKAFVKFMTSRDNVVTMAEFFPPVRLSVLASEAFLTSNPLVPPEEMAIIGDSIARGSAIPSHRNFPQIDATARPIFDNMWRADADVAAVLNQVCNAIAPLLTTQ